MVKDGQQDTLTADSVLEYTIQHCSRQYSETVTTQIPIVTHAECTNCDTDSGNGAVTDSVDS